jgi:hypothetical protein
MPPPSATGSSSLGALGVVRNLPTGVTSAARHPLIAPAQARRDPQEDPEHGGIGLWGELALRHVAAGLRIERVEPNTVVEGRFVGVLDPAYAACFPNPRANLRPRDLDAGIAG